MSIQFSSPNDLINMKVIVAVILALGSASALGSGPYLPSGWRPQGPAFFLPTEVQRPADNPLKETLFFEAQASGSEDLREYGPPKIQEVQESLNVVQTLPDVVTDQAFYVIGNAVEEQVAEVKVEQKADIVEEVTESQVTESAEAKTQDFEVEAASTASYEAVTEKVAEIVQAVAEVQEVEATATAVVQKSENIIQEVKLENTEEKLENVVEEKLENVEEKIENVEEKLENVEEKLESVIEQKLENVIEEKLENVVVQEFEKVVETVEGVKNIAEALINIENEIKAEQVQQSFEAAGELKITQDGSGSKVPEGFLEYGPPGFREYGPPKGELLRTIESNEARRRRFSPKFRSAKTTRH